ncbi:MAG: hypothetical protein EA351_10990 [Gemmatimonadales bacterium]|nr:MAG: hypothetical protein EA351_10990 [Gemmatimonadales bacterium]
MDASSRRGGDGRRFWLLLLLSVIALVGLSACGFGEDASPDPSSDPQGELPATDARPPIGAWDDPEGREGPEGVPLGPAPVLEVERPFWWGEDTRGAEISATFLTPEARRTVLDPDGLIGHFDGREWRLADVLVQVRFRGPRAGATWQIAGPDEVIASYLDELRTDRERSPLDDVGVLEMVVEPCCGVDRDREPRPDLPPESYESPESLDSPESDGMPSPEHEALAPEGHDELH